MNSVQSKNTLIQCELFSKANQQYNHDPFEKMLKYASNRDVLNRFEQPSVRLSVEADLQMVGHYDKLLTQLATVSKRPQHLAASSEVLSEGFRIRGSRLIPLACWSADAGRTEALFQSAALASS